MRAKRERPTSGDNRADRLSSVRPVNDYVTVVRFADGSDMTFSDEASSPADARSLARKWAKARFPALAITGVSTTKRSGPIPRKLDREKAADGLTLPPADRRPKRLKAVDDRSESTSVRTIGGGLPGLGRRR